MRRRMRNTLRAMVSSWVGGADITGGVVEDKVLDMYEFAIDPQRCAGVGEMHPLDPASAGGGRSARRDG